MKHTSSPNAPHLDMPILDLEIPWKDLKMGNYLITILQQEYLGLPSENLREIFSKLRERQRAKSRTEFEIRF
jgi:hypothetical protein